ncbi:MAG: hypothetical protein V3W37_07725 [Candidatus Binatia bacterium]
MNVTNLARGKQHLLRHTILDGIHNGRTLNSTYYPPPYYWATQCTETFDEKWKQKNLSSPYRPFPEAEYLRWLFDQFLHTERLFVPKSREMIISWAAMSYFVWHCQVHPRSRIVVQCQKEDKAGDLIKGGDVPGYARTLYERQPKWIQAKFPLTKPLIEQPMLRMSWANESLIMGVPKGADQVRQYHPTIYYCDEAAFVDDFYGSYGAADPVAAQIIAVSSAEEGYFMDICDDAIEAAGVIRQ